MTQNTFVKALVGIMIALAPPAFAQDAEPKAPPCSAPAYRQMDFWVGTWDAAWGENGKGSNVITRSLGDCAIEERFSAEDSDSLRGFSISTYRPSQQQWHQLWVDNQGGYLPFTGGRVGEDFVLSIVRSNDTVPHLRMVFENIEKDRFDWRWQRSDDEGKSWRDLWHIKYTRRQ